jgi:non-homologous end joining protein Ku
MYKHKAIENFIDRVNKEAAKAAQQVYDKYQPELLKMIQDQIHQDDVLTVGMGSAGIDRPGKDMYNITDKFTRVIAQTQYTNEEFSGFNLPYTIRKNPSKPL